MSGYIQQAMQPPMESRWVYYSNGSANVDLKVGYAVCYDLSQPKTPAAGTFDEMVYGRVVVRPASANLSAFAGIVKTLGARTNPASTTDFSRMIEIVVPRRGDVFYAYCKVNATAESTTLNCVDGQFELGGSGTGYTILAYASETANTSGTAAIKPCRALV